MHFQKLHPVFNMGVDVMRPHFNFEPKYRDSVLTREEWIRGPGISSTVKSGIQACLVYMWVQNAGAGGGYGES